MEISNHAESGPQHRSSVSFWKTQLNTSVIKNKSQVKLAWTVLECLATAKIAELKGELAAA